MTFLSFAALATTLFAADASIPPADGITAVAEVHSGGPPMTGGWTLSSVDVMPDDMALPAWVETPAVVTLADPAKPSPAPRLKLGIRVRGRIDIRFNDVNGAGDRATSTHASFDTLILSANYDGPRFFGSADYRFYGGNFIYGRRNGYQGYPGEIQFLSYAYAGAKLSPNDRVTVGIQPVPFDDRYWGSSWYNSLGFVYGLEEVYNTGISYTHSDDRVSVSAGFFPVAGPPGIGNSRDSARYSVNIVRGDPYLPFASRNAERNMAIGKVRYTLASTARGQLSVTGSGWASQVHSFDTGENGSRHAFALSLKDDRRPLRFKLLAAHQDIDPRNAERNDLIAVGDYDFSYNIAAKGTLTFVEMGHAVDTGSFPFSLDVYASYARVLKKAAFADTQRINVGAFWNDKASKRIRIWTEMLVGRNDPYAGAGQFTSGAAQGGDNRWKASVLMMFGYYM